MSTCACRQRRCILCEAVLSSDGLGRQQICEIRGMIERRVFRARERLFQEGMPVRDLFILRYGYVKLSAGLADGRSQGLRLGLPWSLIGIEALSDETYPCSAEAATDVQVCTVRRDALLDVLRDDPATAFRFIECLNRELRQSLFQIRNIGAMGATERVAAFLLSVVPEQSPTDDEVQLPITRGDIGEILGLAVETVSRVLARLRRDGVIDVPAMGRHFRVLDWERLASLGGHAGDAARDCA